MIRGTQGYEAQASELVERYESIGFSGRHEAVLHLLPAAPATVLDIGAGSGADAAWLADRGHAVLAVEPTAAMRSRAMALHPSPSIEWLDDSLPALANVVSRRQRFGLVMLTAVWMHLDADERRSAMPVVASLLAPAGVMAMAIRHGPVPSGRVMFEVDSGETIELAQACGLRTLLDVNGPSRQAVNRDAGVTWSRLVFTAAA